MLQNQNKEAGQKSEQGQQDKNNTSTTGQKSK